MTTIVDNKLFQDNTTVEAIRHPATHAASKVNAQLILATGQKHKYSVGDTIQPRVTMQYQYLYYKVASNISTNLNSLQALQSKTQTCLATAPLEKEHF